MKTLNTETLEQLKALDESPVIIQVQGSDFCTEEATLTFFDLCPEDQEQLLNLGNVEKIIEVIYSHFFDFGLTKNFTLNLKTTF